MLWPDNPGNKTYVSPSALRHRHRVSIVSSSYVWTFQSKASLNSLGDLFVSGSNVVKMCTKNYSILTNIGINCGFAIHGTPSGSARSTSFLGAATIVNDIAETAVNRLARVAEASWGNFPCCDESLGERRPQTCGRPFLGEILWGLAHRVRGIQSQFL